MVVCLILQKAGLGIIQWNDIDKKKPIELWMLDLNSYLLYISRISKTEIDSSEYVFVNSISDCKSWIVRSAQ